MEITIIVPTVHKFRVAEQISQQLERLNTMRWQMQYGEYGESAGCTYNKAMEARRNGLFLFWNGVAKLDVRELDKVLSEDRKEEAVWIGVENKESIMRFSGNAAWIVLTKQHYLEWGVFHEGLENLTLLEYVIRGQYLGKNAVYHSANCPPLKKTFEMLQEGCYVLSKYGGYLQGICEFNSFAEAILQTAGGLGWETRLIPYMERMLSRKEEYWRMETYVSPILILTGDPVCYGILARFAKGFAKALTEIGYRVEVFNMEKRPWQELRMYSGKRFLAVVGFQTVLFSVHSKQGGYLLDDIGGYKMNFVYDHPLNMPDHIQMPLKDYYILTWDGDYAQYIREFYPNVTDTFRVLTVGTVSEQVIEKVNNRKLLKAFRPYDVVFIGSYHDYRKRFAEMKQIYREIGKTARLFLERMKHYPNQNAEMCLHSVLDSLASRVTNEEFRDLLSRLRPIYRGMLDYTREKIIAFLLDQGIVLHVFSDSWEDWPHNCDRLIVHPTLRGNQVEEILLQSKISFNIMSGHKNGFTERIVNSMLCGAAVVTDKSIYIEKEFENWVELCTFDLERIRDIPQIIRKLLENEDGRVEMTERAYQTAVRSFTGRKQASEFIDIIREQRKKEQTYTGGDLFFSFPKFEN